MRKERERKKRFEGSKVQWFKSSKVKNKNKSKNKEKSSNRVNSRKKSCKVKQIEGDKKRINLIGEFKGELC
ncbi:MAG: hypothetical protein Q8O10_07915 [candidate division Zixibacteria bacterium]|nr:hypothetical protein [candidate division Zixibacteria bacterium]